MAARPKAPPAGEPPSSRPALLCISPSFAPETTPTAIRAGKLLDQLSAVWDITVLSAAGGAGAGPGVTVETVRPWRPARILAGLRRLRLDKLLELFVWPDESIFWALPAAFAARRLIRRRRPQAIVVFMMPYSGGLTGALVSRMSGLPLVLNLDDSPTCTDMHPYFPTRLHHRLARQLEDHYIRRADAVIYVSARNLASVAERQPGELREKLHLVRYGADQSDFHARPAASADFQIAYVGAMSGWWSLIDDEEPSAAARMYDAWSRLGRHELTQLDQRTSSPAVIGRAILDVLAEQPSWAGRLRLEVYGNPYPEALVARALASAGVEGVVAVHGPVAHAEVPDILAGADLLFLTLPRRVDGSAGGRISAKTYEYLATDRPILAAVPRGENWDYLEGRSGVWLVEPDDQDGMRRVIAELAAAKLGGAPRTFARPELREELSYAARADEFASVIREAISRAG